MAEKQIAAIMIAASPYQTEYVVGFDSLDLTGGLLNVVYQDGTFEQVPLSDQMGFYVNNGKIGPSTVKVSYEGFETAFQITIRTPRPKQISIITPPDKTEYMEGEKIDLTGLRLLGVYDNGAELELQNIPTLDHTAKMGEAVVPLPVEGFLVPILIKVNQNQAASLSVRNLPKKLSYMEKTEDFDPAGGMLEKKLQNGRIELVPLTADMVAGFDNTKVGKQVLTVSYGGRQCSFKVEITPRVCSELTLKSLPVKRNYVEETKFELYGIAVTGSAKGEVWDIPIKELNLKDPVAHLGEMSMVVIYQDKSLEIPVTIVPRSIISISVKTRPHKTSYKEGVEDLSLEGGLLELRYDNGTTEIIAMDQAEPSGFDNNKVGEQKVELTYQGKSTTMLVDIIPKTLLGICISKPPLKLDYMEGEIFASAGMEVTGLYDTGVMQKLERYQIMPVRALKKDDTAVVVSYVDKTAIVTITVKAREVEMRAPERVVPKANQFYPSTVGLRFS